MYPTRRALAFLLAVCMTLTACGAQNAGPSGQAASEVPPDVMSGAISAASDAISATAEAVAKAGYDDRLIRDCFLGEGVVPPDGGEGPYEYRLPEILADTPDALKINEEIAGQIGAAVETSLTAIENGSLPPFRRIGWQSGWNGSLVSLLISGETDASFTDYSVYHYDFDTGRRLTDEELAERCGYAPGETADAVRRAAAASVDEPYLASSDINAYDGSYPLQRARAIPIYGDTPYFGLWLDGEGTLFAIVPYDDPTSGMWRYRMLPLSHPEQKDLPEVREEFVSARLTEGVITVSYSDSETAGWFLSAKDGESVEKDIAAEGFWGTYQKLFIGTIGQELHPYLFALRDDGGLEFTDLFAGYEAGRVCSAGLLPGVRGVTAVEDGEVLDPEGGGYHTQFGVTEKGQRIDLAEAVDLMGWDLDQSIRGSWYAEASPSAGGDGSLEYSLEIGGDGSLTVFVKLSEGESSKKYSGEARYIGSAGGSLLLSYRLLDEEYAFWGGSFYIEPLEDSMYLTPSEGDGLFGSAGGTLRLVRAYG